MIWEGGVSAYIHDWCAKVFAREDLDPCFEAVLLHKLKNVLSLIFSKHKPISIHRNNTLHLSIRHAAGYISDLIKHLDHRNDIVLDRCTNDRKALQLQSSSYNTFNDQEFLLSYDPAMHSIPKEISGFFGVAGIQTDPINYPISSHGIILQLIISNDFL